VRADPLLWSRWSVRDLRARWPLVAATALVIALGTGVFAALGSTETWRRESNDLSFAAGRVHDLRVELPDGSFVADGTLATIVASMDNAADVDAVEERLIVPIHVDASTAGRTVLLPGELIGASTATTRSTVDRVVLSGGRDTAPSSARPEVVLDDKVADERGLAESGTILLSGAATVRYVGVGTAPEQFMLTGAGGGAILAEGGFAPVYTSLATAQAITGRTGLVNDLVLRVAPGAPVDAVARDLTAALGTALPGTAATVTGRRDIDAYRILYDDIDNDQRLWNIISGLVLLAATGAAATLVSRMVEAQRREIGVGMALGVSKRLLALRPVLVGLEIATLGAVLGVGVGVGVGALVADVVRDTLPLPIWRTGFQPDVYARALVLGLSLPLLGAIPPIWRAVRVEPVQALASGHRGARRPWRAGLLRLAHVPGGSFVQMPFRALLAAPRRSLTTVVAIAATLAVLVATRGTLDSFEHMVDVGEEEIAGDAPDRITVALDGFVAVDDVDLTALAELPGVDAMSSGLQLGAVARRPDGRGATVELLLDLVDPATAVWLPSTADAVDAGGWGGLVLSHEAASDLRVEPGDVVVVQLPRRTGASSFDLVDVSVVVSALHANPLRPFAYLPLDQAAPLGLERARNVVQVVPSPGADRDALLRSLVASPAVASAQPATATVTAFRSVLDDYTGILGIAAAIVFLLTALIAFNAVTIGVEERAREQATMFAFGVPRRVVVAGLAVEGVVLGVVGTALGMVGGRALLAWIVARQIPDILPEVAVTAHLTGATLATTAVLGVGAVAAAPLLVIRRLGRMDVPSALRVGE
jgi:putative ABC transport system permease protein